MCCSTYCIFAETPGGRPERCVFVLDRGSKLIHVHLVWDAIFWVFRECFTQSKRVNQKKVGFTEPLESPLIRPRAVIYNSSASKFGALGVVFLLHNLAANHAGHWESFCCPCPSAPPHRPDNARPLCMWKRPRPHWLKRSLFPLQAEKSFKKTARIIEKVHKKVQ